MLTQKGHNVITRARCLAAMVSVVVACTTAPAADASSTNNLQALRWGTTEDYFYNYDFNSQDANYRNVDWGINLLFWNNAWINKVKDAINSPYNAVGSTKYARINEGGGWLWDSDAGRKTIKCPTYKQHAKHYRIYADGDDKMYNTSNGFYVIGSTHIDYRECAKGRWHGEAERAEDDVAYWIRRNKGWSTAQDYANYYNYEPYYQEGNHRWDSDGRATAINVP